MTTLRNKLPHMAGQSVTVNGQRYQIDSTGIAEIDDPLAVDKLVQNREAWSLVTTETPKKAEKTQKSEAPKAVEIPKKVEAPTPAKTIVREPIVEKEKTESKEKTDATTEDGWVDWPDPDPTMSIGYLRQMADAYPSVNYTIKTPKSELIKRIYAAMYDTVDEDE